MNRFVNLITLIALLLSVATLHAEDTRWQEAAKQYAAQNYDSAATIYFDAIERGEQSADLYYNYANTQFKLGKMGPAILFYERSLQLDPTHSDAGFNLSFANQKITDKIDSVQPFFLVSWFQSLGQLFASNSWAYLSVGLFVLALCMVLAFIFGRYRWMRKSAFVVAIAAVCLSLLSCIYAFTQLNRAEDRTNAIVMVGSLTVKSSPDQSGTDLFVLHEGTKLTILSTNGTWCEIRIMDGQVGWVPSNTFERI